MDRDETVVTDPIEEEARCPFCGLGAFSPFQNLGDWLYHPENRFQLVECDACRGLFLHPPPDPLTLSLAYPATYAPYHDPAQKREGAWMRLQRWHKVQKRCNVVKRLLPSGRLLDIGCATGDFISRMRALGAWQVTGLEPNLWAAQRARELYALDIVSQPVESAEFDAGSFDVVTMWDVIEHVTNPGETLKRIAQWLRPEGVLVLRTVNARSVQAALWKEHWAGYDAPRHLTVPDKPLLSRLLREAGFETSQISSREGSPAMFALSWAFWLSAHGWSSSWQLATDNPLSRVILRAFLPLLDLGRGPLLLAVAYR